MRFPTIIAKPPKQSGGFGKRNLSTHSNTPQHAGNAAVDATQHCHPVTLEDLRAELESFAHGELRNVLNQIMLAVPLPSEQPAFESETSVRVRKLSSVPTKAAPIVTPKPWQPFARSNSCLNAPVAEEINKSRRQSKIEEVENSDFEFDASDDESKRIWSHPQGQEKVGFRRQSKIEGVENSDFEVVARDDESKRKASHPQGQERVGFRRDDWFEMAYPTRVQAPHPDGEEDEDADHQRPLLQHNVPTMARSGALDCDEYDEFHDTENFYSHIHQHKNFLRNATNYDQATGAEMIIGNEYFELAMALLVVFSAGLVGFEADRALYVSPDNHAEGCQALHTCFADVFCAVVFTAELLLRIAATGTNFFRVRTWRWNLFDFVILFMQWMYLSVVLFPKLELPVAASIIRMLRFLRIVRIFRLVRYLSELQLIVKSITATVTGVIWALVLLMVIVYVCSVLFLQIVSVHHVGNMHPHVNRWFGGLFRTMLTLIECIFGGVGWEQVVGPLVTNISPWLGVAFVLYVSMTMVALLNLVTGLFVEKVTQTVRDSRDTDLARSICDLFIKDVEVDQELTWDEFAEKMKSPAMQDFFREIQVDSSEAMGFFYLMDTNNSGSVSADEIVNGCLRLRGPAKSLDIAILVRAVDNIELQLAEMIGDRKRCNTHDLVEPF